VEELTHREGDFMALLADLYRWMCMDCVRLAAVLVVLSPLGCGGDDTLSDTSDLDKTNFPIEADWKGCGESFTAELPTEAPSDPNDDEVCCC